MKARRGLDSGRGLVRRHAALAIAAVLVMFASAAPSGADVGAAATDGTGVYAGVFAGSGRTDNRLIDVDGFADWGNPGSTTDYDRRDLVGGVLAGRTFEVNGTRLRLEIDGTFGDLSARTNALDPTCADESAESVFRWALTARLGVQETLGPATLFATGGLAAARIVNSVTDIDYSGTSCLQMDLRLDPDDSFRDSSTEVGWVIGVGVETPLADAWTLRLDGSYLDFGRSTYRANRAGDGRCCGSGSERRPVSYVVENRLGIVRLAIIRRFDP